jgi:hypothetical protein
MNGSVRRHLNSPTVRGASSVPTETSFQNETDNVVMIATNRGVTSRYISEGEFEVCLTSITESTGKVPCCEVDQVWVPIM